MKKLSGKTFNNVNHILEKLKDAVPEIFTDGKIDVEKLHQTLGDYVEKSKERYDFTWYGKSEAIQLAQKQTTGTLRPCKEESVNWDTTENLYIEGDNLEILRTLQNSYRKKVKMIYIDPPYNTGKDFIYKDNFHDNVTTYKERLGENYKSNAETSGRYHTDWLNMMYPRLKIAKNLLRKDGFIAVSISDEEFPNLRKIMDEIFGESNFRNDILVRRYDKNINNQFVEKGLKSLNVGSEHILIYASSEEALFNAVYRKSSEDRSSKGYWKGFWNDANRPTMRYEILGYTPSEGQWKWKKETADEAVQNYIEYQENYSGKYTLEEYWEKTGKEKKFIRRRKHLTGKNMGVEHWVSPTEGILRSSNWNDLLVSESISNLGLSFDSPKSTKLIKELIRMLAPESDSIILDFFSGSSSTAHAVMEYNLEYNENKKFIMAQLPELIDENTTMYNEGFKNLCEIGKERIRRVGKKILKEIDSNQINNMVDIGFKVFKLDETNLKIWDEESEVTENDLWDIVNPIKEGRTQEDLVYEILLKYGVSLTAPIQETNILDKKVYDIGLGYLLICIENDLTLKHIEEIAKTTPSRVVLFDEGFKDDSIKINAYQVLRRFNVRDVRVI